jgi:HEAT repeat protein
MDARAIRRELEAERLSPDDALAALAEAIAGAGTSALRLEACRAIGEVAGRAYGASWDVAERGAFLLLEVARETDAPAERAGLLHAMGRAFRNAWLVPYVHARLRDADELVVSAAISAAGGLGFPALEEAVAAFLDGEHAPALRLAAIAALGRMGAETGAARLSALALSGPEVGAAALSALTEIRSREGEAAALELVARDPPKHVLVAAMRYLAELGRPEVLGVMRRLARDEDVELRLAAGLASRAFRDATRLPAEERLLSALTERDRAVRAALARRLRTLPVAEVVSRAELLLSEDPEGVVQILAEVRAPEVTRMLLALAAEESASVAVRARAAGSIEADETWERDALLELVRTSEEVQVRVAAAQNVGAFAPPDVVLDQLGALADDRSPALRGALLWALQLAARPGALEGRDRARADAILGRALADEDAGVRRRAAYVAGNLDAGSLVPALVELARSESERADLRIAAFVGLGEIGSGERLADLVHLFQREDDPAALGAASRALERAALADPEKARSAIAKLKDRVSKLLASGDPRVRAAGARVAGLAPGAAPVEKVAALADDAAPRVREQAIGALGRIGGEAADAALAGALDDADPVIQERAALGLLSRGTAEGVARVLELVARADETTAQRVASRIALPSGDPAPTIAALDAAIRRVGPLHAAYETLLELKIAALDAQRPSAPPGGPHVDAAIAAAFPTWTKLSTVRGFAPLARSLRTAETLYGAAASADADQSAAIVLWTKSLEGYLHAWLSPRLAALQQQGSLYELVDRFSGGAWPTYQRWLSSRWPDPVDVGGISVELPVRSVVNVLRELQDRRPRSLGSPLSVTEWARMMLFLALDHPSGPKNVLAISNQDPDRAARVAHRLQILAQVRNAVTHRSVASRATLEGFRSLYYPTFEEVTSMA